MNKNIYIGGLSYTVNNNDLEKIFSTYGTVQSAKVITDRHTGDSKGFAFVEMGTSHEAQAAINSLNGTEIEGKTIAVSEARPQESNGSGRKNGGGYGGGRGRY